jgi:hypothetical protein
VPEPGAEPLRGSTVPGLDPVEAVLVQRQEHDQDEQLADHEHRHRQADQYRERGEPVEQAERPGGADDADREPGDQPVRSPGLQ